LTNANILLAGFSLIENHADFINDITGYCRLAGIVMEEAIVNPRFNKLKCLWRMIGA